MVFGIVFDRTALSETTCNNADVPKILFSDDSQSQDGQAPVMISASAAALADPREAVVKGLHGSPFRLTLCRRCSEKHHPFTEGFPRLADDRATRSTTINPAIGMKLILPA
jgi:hypothetical protein